MKLHNKVAVVTGGAVRLGRAMALALAAQGVHLAIHYGSSTDAAQETVAQIQAIGSEAVAIQADLRQAALAPTLIERAVAHFGRVDILVNSAAIYEPGGLSDTTEDNWDKHFAINLKASFFLSQAFAACAGRERPGHIINIADWRAIRPGADHLTYTLTKATLITMTQSLACALAPNIQVNAIAPGEVVKALLFLLDSDFVTGDLIPVTGGQHL